MPLVQGMNSILPGIIKEDRFFILNSELTL